MALPGGHDVRRMTLVEHHASAGIPQAVQANTAQPGPSAQPLELVGVELGAHGRAILMHRPQPVVGPPAAEGQGLGALALSQRPQRGHAPMTDDVVAAHNPYGDSPGVGISLPPYFPPTPSVKNNNTFFPQTEELGPDEMRISFVVTKDAIWVRDPALPESTSTRRPSTTAELKSMFGGEIPETLKIPKSKWALDELVDQETWANEVPVSAFTPPGLRRDRVRKFPPELEGQEVPLSAMFSVPDEK